MKYGHKIARDLKDLCPRCYSDRIECIKETYKMPTQNGWVYGYMHYRCQNCFLEFIKEYRH